MKLFVNENDTVSGSLYIGSKDDKIICFDNESAAKGISGLGEIVKHDFVFRKINFGISKKIQSINFFNLILICKLLYCNDTNGIANP